jgi:uncharacterized membrane protein YcaP (DUF421 family)
MIFRAIIVFFTTLIFIRIAGIRTLGKQSSFDTLTSLMLGAIMGRAVVTEQSFFGSILATLVLMLLHRLVAWVTFKSRKAGAIIKGCDILLMRGGEKQQKNLAATHITEEDIMEVLRRDLNTTSLDKIKEVYLERSGNISFIKE